MLPEFSRWPLGRAAACTALVLTSLLAPALASGATVVDRDEYSTTVDVGGGKLKTSLSSEPLNYQTASGAWKPIDTGLAPEADGDLHPAAVDGDVAIPDSLTQPIELEHDGHAASFRLLGAEGDADADGSEASFAHAIPGVDVSYVARAYGVKETLELQSALAPRSFAYDLRGGSSWSASVESGDVVLRDGGGMERYRVSAPLAWDSAPDPAFTNTLNLSASKVSDGRWRVTLRPDADWLSDPTRQFPVSIDPDFSWSNGTTHFHGAQDCYLSGYTQAIYTFCAQTYLQTGWYNRPYRSIFKFDIASAIPSNATVSAAQFKAFAPPQTAHIAMGHKLQTITSDWDSTATWNNRKTGTPWTTSGGGGDVSTAANLTSASTTVQAYNAWYSWNAPLAAVQGWVNGSLPNYGFMLSTDNAGNIGNAYAWASTEASTTSQFPADSTKWPTLDVTWAAAIAADNTPPSAATDLSLGDIDRQDATSFLSFLPGDDVAGSNGVAPSGVDRSEFRYRVGPGDYSEWQRASTDGVAEAVLGVVDGSSVSVDVRTVDRAGNVSAISSISQTLFGPDSALQSKQDNATAWYAAHANVSTAVAEAWIDTQQLASVADQDIRASSSAPSYAGYWFDNQSRRAHFGVTTSSAQAAVAAAVAARGLASSSIVDTVAWSDSQLAQSANVLQSSLSTLFDAGKIQIESNVKEQTVSVRLASSLTASERSQISSARQALAVPTREIEAGVPSLAPDYLACAKKPIASRPSQQAGYCAGPLRGGTAIIADDTQGARDICTAGFNGLAEDGSEVLITAGHCAGPGPKADPAQAVQYTLRVKDRDGRLKPSLLGAVEDRYRKFGNGKYDAMAIGLFSRWGGKTFRPWVLVLATPGDGPGEILDPPPIPPTTRDAQYAIQRVRHPAIDQLVCATGASSYWTSCGYVTARSNALDYGWRVSDEACLAHGDSGGPVYARGSAFGIISQLVPGRVCGYIFQDALELERILKVQILTPARAAAANLYTAGAGYAQCASGWMYIAGAGCLLIL